MNKMNRQTRQKLTRERKKNRRRRNRQTRWKLTRERNKKRRRRRNSLTFPMNLTIQFHSPVVSRSA